MKAIAKTIAQPFTLPSTYLKATLFVIISVIIPFMMHYFSLGSIVLLPLLFITFFAAFRFGWAVGLLTAIASPLVSNVISGMPPGVMLYIVLAQCVIIASLVGVFAKNTYRLSSFQVLAIIAAYQFIAFVIQSLLFNATIAFDAIVVSLPGMLLQLIFFTVYSRYLMKKIK